MQGNPAACGARLTQAPSFDWTALHSVLKVDVLTRHSVKSVLDYTSTTGTGLNSLLMVTSRTQKQCEEVKENPDDSGIGKQVSAPTSYSRTRALRVPFWVTSEYRMGTIKLCQLMTVQGGKSTILADFYLPAAPTEHARALCNTRNFRQQCKD